MVCLAVTASSFFKFYPEVETGCFAYLETKPKTPQLELGSGVQFCFCMDKSWCDFRKQLLWDNSFIFLKGK